MEFFRVAQDKLNRVKTVRQEISRQRKMTVQDERWLSAVAEHLPRCKRGELVPISLSTWKRFFERKKIRADNFQAICEVLSLAWQEVVDPSCLSDQQSLTEHLTNIENDDKRVFEQTPAHDRLRNLLANNKWKEADIETAKIMLEIIGKENYLQLEDFENFPVEDLRSIDKLWVQYSSNFFGFSIQKQIWIESNMKMELLGEKVGWKKQGQWLNYSQLSLSLKSPKGQLPWCGHLAPNKHVITWGLRVLLSNCNLID